MERFEPVGSACREAGFLLLQCLLPAHQLGLFGHERFAFDKAVQKGVQQLLKPEIDFVNLLALLRRQLSGGLGCLLLFLANPCEHCVRPIRPKRKRLQQGRDLGVQSFLADIWLLAPCGGSILFGATVIYMPLLDFGRNAAATFPTAKKLGEGFGLELHLFGRPSPTASNDSLHVVEQFLADDRLVFALVHLSAIAKMPIVNRIGQNLGYVLSHEQLAVSGANAALGKELPHIVIIGIASCIHLKRLLDNGSTLPVQDNCSGAIIVQIAQRGHGGEFTAPDLFAQSALGVFRQGIHVVFALAEQDVQHELALGVGLKAKSGEFERFDFARIQEKNDPPSVNRIAGQTVWMPGQNSVGFSRLYAFEHGVKNRPAGSFGGLFFNELCNDIDGLALSEFAQFV